MNFVFSKNKEKRSRSSTGESNSSFVKNVTSRVSGLLPAGITKWFSSPSSSTANGSVAVADGTDSSTEDETTEGSILQPPAKRLRYSSPVGKYSLLTTSETTLTSNIVTETRSVLYNSIQSPPGRHTFRRDTNFISTPTRAHTDDTMNTSTMMEGGESDHLFKQHTVSAIGQSIALKRKSLFDSQKQKEQSLIACAKTAANQVRDIKQPYFKPHLLGSPFYPGRTMYGGASASTTYINRPNIKGQKVAHVNKSKDSDAVNMSNSARRVLDLLENYSSPLIEAKRIPRYELSELRGINSTLQTSTTSGRSYKSQELYIPSTASIIRMKARSRLMDSTKAARQIIASHSSTLAPYPTYASDTKTRDQGPENDFNQAKSQSKLKSRLTRPNRGDDPFGLPETVELPTAVLHIDKNNLPKFSFGGSTSKLTQTSTSNTPGKEHFTFSSPLPITLDAKKNSSQAAAFDFSSPEKAAYNTSPPILTFGKKTTVETNTPLTTKKDEPLYTTKDTIITSKTSNDWKCSDCWVSNKAEAQKCACCGANPPKPSKVTTSETISKCANCKFANSQPNAERCVNCEKVRASLKRTNSVASNVTVNLSKWKCGECWVDNEAIVDKCVCCGIKNPKKSIAPTGAVNTTKIVDAVTKDWRCEDCLITNKPNIEICVACGGSKPGTKAAAKTLPTFASSNLLTTPDNKLAEIVKAQKAYWECSVCLASNANEKSMCVCCNAEKEGNDSVAPKFNNFKFKAEANTSFKFGIDPKVQETNLAKELPKPKNLEESETNNNIVPKEPSFTIPVPAKKSRDNKITENDNASKPSFSFGIPKQNATPVATGFIPISTSDTKVTFGATKNTEVPVEDTEKPQEVPTISFKAPEATKPSTDLFSTLSSNPQNAMNVFLNNSVEKKTAELPSKKRSSATLETSKPQFSFGAANPNTSGLFTASVPTTANSSLTQNAPATTLVMGMFPKPETTITPAVSFFAKPETTPAPTPLFQNNVNANATAPAPAAATSMFSFGTNQNTAPATDPKKFNFSFGSSTATPTFGATPPTNASTFSVRTSNPLANGISNPLGGNSMDGSGGNELHPTGNGLLGSNSASLFNEPAKQNTSMWPSTNEQTNQANLFMASTPTKPTFSFGATSVPSPFGAQTSNAPHVFGGSPAPAHNMFGMNQTNASQPSMFPNSAASQPAPMFGSPQATNTAPSMGIFGTSNVTPFGASTSSMPTFEAPGPAPASAFSFGASQATPGIFGFGQQAQQPQQQQAGLQQMQQAGIQGGMYSFGTAPSPGQVQFTMGSAPSATAGRRVRKAVRRNQQR